LIAVGSSAAIVALVLAAAAGPAAAAEPPSAELFAGYSYTKNGDESLNGGEVSLAIRLTRWIAAEADLSAHYGSSLGTHDRRLFFMGGPRFAYRGAGVTVFVHYLAGGARTGSGLSVLGVDITQTRTDFAMAFGGGVDAALSKRWAVRAQADYALVFDDADGATEKEPRFSAGFVYRFSGR
jgi:outer membrane protein with beta-barrel domain